MPTKDIEELRSMIGRSRVTVEGMRIEAGKVAEFARAIGDDDPVYREEDDARDRGFDAVPAPLTFVRTSAFPRYRPDGTAFDDHLLFGFDLGFDPRRRLHAEQEYEFERPLYVGDTLTGTTTLVDVFEREGEAGGEMTFATFETEFRNGDGALVVTERMTYVETAGEERER